MIELRLRSLRLRRGRGGELPFEGSVAELRLRLRLAECRVALASAPVLLRLLLWCSVPRSDSELQAVVSEEQARPARWLRRDRRTRRP
jgi:hypothetical protein